MNRSRWGRLKLPASIALYLRRAALIAAIAAGGLFRLSAGESAGFLPIITYTPVEVGAPTETSQILQDGNGQLYFAGRSLLTFDGERWMSHPLTSGYLLRSIEFGADGVIWAASAADLGYFKRTEDLRWEYHSLRDRVPPEHAAFGEVWRVFAEENGATFVSENRILRWDGRAFRVWQMSGARRLFSSRVGDSALVHYQPEGLYELAATGPRLVIPSEVLGDAMISWAERNSAGWLLGTSKGFFLCDGKKMSPFAPDLVPFLEENKLMCATRLADGQIAVGTVKGGLAIIGRDGSVQRFINAREGLASPYVTSLFVDRDKQLWATTSSQIARIDLAGHTSILDERAGLPRIPVKRIAVMGDRIAVANEAGVFAMTSLENSFHLVKGLPSGVKTLLPTDEGLFVAGYRGVMLWNGSEVRPLYPSVFDSYAVIQRREASPAVLIADNRRIVSVDPSGTVASVVAGLPATATSLAESENGTIWIGSYDHGLFSASLPQRAAVRADGPAGGWGLPTLKGFVHVRSATRDSVMVFANEGAWIFRAGDKQFRAVSSYPERATHTVSFVAGDNSLWTIQEGANASTSVITRLSVGDREVEVTPLALDALPTIGPPECIFAENYGGETVLWIGGTRGALRYVPSKSGIEMRPRQPAVRAFARVGDTNSRLPVITALPYDTHSIELEFSSHEYLHRANIRLESRLDGIDRDWVTVGPQATRELSGIRDSRYTVRLRAVTPSGLSSPEATLTFEVLPPWWRTRTALVLEAIGIIAVVVGGYRFRVRSLRRRNAELEAKVRERTEELERASAAKTEFVANMSHDIRNPLNGIVGLALALEDTRLDSRQREMVATLRECTTYLSSLVDDVLDFASIEAGKVELRPGAFSAEDLVQSIVTTLKADTAERGATLSVEFGPDLPRALMGDAGRIQQILVNYVSNALKYAGGEIVLAARVPANAPGEIEFSVSDRGPGISREEQALLFTKFSRLAGARRDDIPGAGLGLAACRHLADLMGGSVGVTSEPGAGSRFFLRLPLTVAAAPDVASTATLPNTTVLLVEDTDYNAWAASAVLAKLGLSCDRARDGEEALRLFSERRYNVVLLDRNLPDMDGTDVARRLRAMETEGPPAILLAVTAYCTAEDRQKCLDAGMDAFVGKPLTPEKLRRVLIAAGRRLLATATVQAEPETAPRELDTSLLSYLADDDDPSGFETQVERFLANLDETTEELTRASEGGDYPALGTIAHRLLGQARMIGCNALVRVAASLESAARAENSGACGELMEAVRAEIATLRAALRHPRTSAQPA